MHRRKANAHSLPSGVAMPMLQIFERPEPSNASLTSAELAVKRFARTVRHFVHLLSFQLACLRSGWCANLGKHQ